MARRSGAYVINEDAGAPLVPDFLGLAFLANITIGEPASEQLVMVDTASTLLWIQCTPCLTCQRQIPLLFEPLKSSTYSNIPCTPPGTAACTDVGGKCDPTNGCLFRLSYFDRTEVSGNLASEKLVFGTSDDGKVTITIKVFGCAHENRALTSDNQQSGILGLGYDNISLTEQLGGKFSICLGDIHDPNYPHNKLIFGEGAVFEGDVTPIVSTQDGFYYVTLDGISVGEEKLNIDPNVFKLSSSGQGGTILDTGTTMMTMNRGGYDPLQNKVQSILNGSLQRTDFSIGGIPMLCYNGEVDRDLSSFPAVSLHLAGGADIVLDTHSMFRQVNGVTLCMAVAPADNVEGMTIIGAFAQQSYNVGYDIAAGKVYVQRIDCELLES
ncbi:aspartic proteinase CDR1-like [Punica granatum]|uniref:Aspartic proteinase CDR1-like n=1 Tax=Punica granatum TaxID=22663 RepID=A0A6P8CAT5_PUNGR|nr:aspartic proteinase CDR1-like [Punica granatum]